MRTQLQRQANTMQIQCEDNFVMRIDSTCESMRQLERQSAVSRSEFGNTMQIERDNMKRKIK